MKHQMFNVQGMTCESCVEKITALLSREPAIQNLRVTLSPPQLHFDSAEPFDALRLNNLLSPLGKYKVGDLAAPVVAAEPFSLLKYTPLILLFGLSAGVPALNSLVNHAGFSTWMHQFMGVTLIALAYFKFLDLPKFAEAFSTYDPVASRVFNYGYVYPFLELIAGIGFVLGFAVQTLSAVVIMILLPTTVGVIRSLQLKRKFQCACLGTAFNLPLTKVTVVENILMIAMGGMTIIGVS